VASNPDPITPENRGCFSYVAFAVAYAEEIFGERIAGKGQNH
jgi:hypothetical protein